MPYIYFIAAVLLGLAYLLPYHRTPWPTFGSEILSLIAAATLLFSSHQKMIKIAKTQILLLPLMLIPAVQYLFGQILYLSNALACLNYAVLFWAMIVVGYNLSDTPKHREQLFSAICAFFIVIGLVSSVIAFCQWLSISSYFSGLMYPLKGNRPYANLAQPNNLATLFSLSLMACLYFYETQKIKTQYLFPIALLLVFSLALTQSRTSWIMCLFILGYWSIKQFKRPHLMHFPKLAMWIGFFIVCIFFLPYLNQGVSAVFGQQVTETTSVVNRATSGFMRLEMWTQVLVAIREHPWLGYGWNQTGMAQIAAFDLYPSHEWYKSAHNMILDLLIWNGVPIGMLIILYFVAWLYWLNRGVKEHISIVATLMVCAVLIHGMLEYPLHYAYFLLPVGVLLGIIQGQYTRLPFVTIHAKWLWLVGALSIAGAIISVKDYILYKQQSAIVAQKTPINPTQQKILDQDILLLTQFRERIWWIQLDSQTQMSNEQLAHIGKMVANLASKYDLLKYAQVLAFNGHRQEAEHQLWILKELHKEEHRYADLLKPSGVGAKK
ncbi:O-antigen ligase family protein [Acinetobacter sp. 194]|uniref:PglL family O-oligosaccharyltransferase n=1 Tax=Acinetobacter shaoyimingii TaxID=2715164 RepID=UPI001409D964|nr:O-antigen ligase family protein [Acinetobacter shaoyimingii]NHB58085.1 O-antigen ligase family protein [Acinetobacter shaoyimingii]